MPASTAAREDDLQLLAQALGLREGARVLDLGYGYGAVSANILAEARSPPIGGDLYLCDLHKAQILSVPRSIEARATQMVVGDARNNLPFPNDSSIRSS